MASLFYWFCSFNGLRGCARKVIYSAWNNYANFGCDIGGYRGGNLPLQKNLFLRWTQFGAFLPLMENGGGGEHRPWMYDAETVEVYRRFAQHHHKLAPYLLTMGAVAMETGTSSVHPIAVKPEDMNPARSPQPTSFSYLLGDSVLVHPVMHEVMQAHNITELVSVVEAVFPPRHSPRHSSSSEEEKVQEVVNKDGEIPGMWLDWWRPHDASLAHAGNSRSLLLVPLTSAAVYVQRSACLPLQRSAEDASVVFTWFGPRQGESQRCDMREPVSEGEGITARMSLSADSRLLMNTTSFFFCYFTL